MQRQLTQKLEIAFDEYSNAYQLWLHYFDTKDFIYPLQHSYLLTISNSIAVLKTYAKNYHPNLSVSHISNYSQAK